MNFPAARGTEASRVARRGTRSSAFRRSRRAQVANAATKVFSCTAIVAGALVQPFVARADVSTDFRAIRATGDGTFFIGDCTGKAVQLIGDRQTITLLGKCASVVSHGSGKRITLDGATILHVFGDENTVKWKIRPDSVRSLGHSNVMTRS